MRIRHRTLLFILFFVGLVSLVTASTFGQAFAQQPESKTWGPNYDAAQMAAYTAAVEDCSNPSLECLVHQTSRYIAIEWVNTILYPAGPPPPGGALPPGSSLDATTSIASARTSFVGGMVSLIGQMYKNPAANTGTYVADLMESAKISTPAYAQGLGFAALDPVLDLWKTFRNVAYMFFVVLFIVIGFMIMFRTKISGQTAVTAQQAIPSIIVSLLFVTFSYAIAGFMIDLMYLIMFMIVGMFAETFQSNPDIINYNILQLAGVLFGATVNFQQNIDIVSNALGSLMSQELSGLATGMGVAGGITLTLVLAIVILIGTFKLFFELLKSYASIVISVVTAPVILMMGAIPGKNTFGPWLKDLLGNLAAFPTVLLIVVLFYEFTQEGANMTGGGFMPPFLIGRGQPGAIGSLMGLALIIALPEIVKKVKEAVGAKDGIGTQIAGWAKSNLQEGWKGNKYIPGARNVVVPAAYGAAAAAGAGAGALGGAAIGGGIKGAQALRGMQFRGQNAQQIRANLVQAGSAARAGAGQGAKVGAVVGGGLPIATGAIGFINRGLRTVKNAQQGLDSVETTRKAAIKAWAQRQHRNAPTEDATGTNPAPQAGFDEPDTR